MPGRRVQRIPSAWPVLHLEASVPSWNGLTVRGMVRHPRRWTLEDLKALGAVERREDIHCVWGWSELGHRWEGIPLSVLLDVCEPEGSWVTVVASSDSYSSCIPLEDAASGFLAWGLDGRPLAAERGGPMRYLPPAGYWAYKGVKWVAELVVVDRFAPGFWESRVADPLGRIPSDVLIPQTTEHRSTASPAESVTFGSAQSVESGESGE